MERVGAADGVRCTSCDSFGDPVSHVSRHMGDLGCSLLSEFVEEHVQGSFRPAGSDPHQAAGIVINNHDQVAVRTFVGDLIDPDSTQTGQTVDGGFNIVVNAGDDRPDGPPRHPQQLTGCTLGGPDRQPGRHGVEVAGVASTVPRPRDLRNGVAVRSTLNSRSVGFNEHPSGASIESPPTPPTSPSVIPRVSDGRIVRTGCVPGC